MFTNIKQYYFTFLLFFCGNAQSRPQVCKTRERLCVVFVVSAYSVYSAVENRRIPGTAAAHSPSTRPSARQTARRTARFRSESDVNAILIFYGQPVAVQMRIVGKLKDAWYGFAGRFGKFNDGHARMVEVEMAAEHRIGNVQQAAEEGHSEALMREQRDPLAVGALR